MRGIQKRTEMIVNIPTKTEARLARVAKKTNAEMATIILHCVSEYLSVIERDNGLARVRKPKL